MAKINWSLTNTQISDEILNVSSSVAVGLLHDIFYNKTGKLVEIWTGAGGTGTQLVESTDYTIGGAIADADLPESITPDVAYTTIAITNATYHNVDLYVSYYPLGDYWESEDVSQLIGGIDLSDQDISSGNQTTDLSVYEPGGSSALQDGAIVNVSWSGGDSTYYHKFTVTSGWTIEAISGAAHAPGDGSTTYAWCGYGNGFIKLKLDINNTRWIVLSGIGGGEVFDKIDLADSGVDQNRIVKQKITKELEVEGQRVATTSATGSYGAVFISSGFSITFGFTFKAIPKVLSGMDLQTSAATWFIGRNWTTTGSTNCLIMDAVSGSRTYNINYKAIGEWRD